MDFERIFDAVDTDNDGVINQYDLRTYARSRNLDEHTFAQKWLNLFDHDGDGIIHENDFRSKLGMNLKEEPVRVTRLVPVERAPERLPIVLKSDMNNSLQHDIIALVMTHSGAFNQYDINLWKLEEDLNNRFGRQWHSRLNASPNDVARTVYARDGMLLLRLPERHSELFIWRTDSRTKKGCCASCFR